jgi:hypothetical protein
MIRTGESITVALGKRTVPFSSNENWDSPPLSSNENWDSPPLISWLVLRSALVLGVLAFIGPGSDLLAGDRAVPPLGAELRCARCMTVPCCCPDNYCRKPPPCIPCPVLGRCPDNYCPKPLPGVCGPAPGGCAVPYCRKPLPKLCWDVDRQFYRCPPPERGAANTVAPLRRPGP